MHFASLNRINSISLKILLAYVVGMLLSVGLIASVLSTAVLLKNNIFSESDIYKYSEELAEGLQFNNNGFPTHIVDDDTDTWLFESISEELAYRVLNESGEVVLYSPSGHSFWSGIKVQNPLTTAPFEFERNGVMMDASTGIVERNGKRWFVQTAVSRRFMNFAHNVFALRFVSDGVILLSLVLFFVFGACAHFVLKVTLRPLRELSESAALISPRSLQARLNEKDIPSEIAPLVKSFNTVLDRLEHGYRLQQEFLATAAHELKTPLSLIRAQLELMEENEDRNWLLNDVEYMSRQVQQLLLLTEASEEQNYKFADVELKEIANEATSYLQRMADNASVKILLQDHSLGIQWFADKGAMFTLLKNLLENAIQHAPTGTEIIVTINTNSLSVRDFGPGVENSELTKVFNRFWRGEHRSDSGAGLGLAICQEIARAHKCTLTVSKAEPGLLFNLLNDEKSR